MREIGVHDDDKVARNVLQAVDVGRAEAEFAGARSQELDGQPFDDRTSATHDSVLAVDRLQLACDVLRAVGARIVDNHNLPVQIVRAKGALEQPDDDGQIASLAVSDCASDGGRTSRYVGRMTAPSADAWSSRAPEYLLIIARQTDDEDATRRERQSRRVVVDLQVVESTRAGTAQTEVL